MSTNPLASRTDGSPPALPPRKIIEISDDLFLGDKPVEQLNPESSKANTQTSKGWHGTAIAVGIFLVLGGVFGGLGLLQAHYHFLPSSFDWLAKAVEFVGNVGPHHAILWALAGAGVLGIGAIAGGSVGVHKARMEEKRIEEKQAKKERLIRKNIKDDFSFKPAILEKGKVDVQIENSGKAEAHLGPILRQEGKITPEIKVQNKAGLALDPKLTKLLARKQRGLEAKRALAAWEAKEQELEAMLRNDNFAKLNVKPDWYQTNLSESTYTTRYFGKYDEVEKTKFIPEAREDRFFVAIKDGDGNLKCSDRLTDAQKVHLVGYLKDKQGYQVHFEKTS